MYVTEGIFFDNDMYTHSLVMDHQKLMRWILAAAEHRHGAQVIVYAVGRLQAQIRPTPNRML